MLVEKGWIERWLHGELPINEGNVIDSIPDSTIIFCI